LPRTLIVPARQSMSSSPSPATSPRRRPSRTSRGQNCQIAVANGRAGIAGRQKAPHLIGLKPLGQPGQSAARNRRHGRDERAFRDAVEMQKAEERTQRRDRQLRHPAVQAWAPRDHEGGDIGRGQAPEFKTIGRHPAVQKRAQTIDIPKGRHRDQAAFRGQELPVPVQDFPGGAVLHGCFGRWRQLQTAQITENGAQCLARLELERTRGTTIRQKTINLRHGQVAHSELPNLQPAAQIAEQLPML
jgi:hypothetical protein